MDAIEQAAKAIYEARNGAGAKPWAKLTKSHRAEYMGDAAAAWKIFTFREQRRALVALKNTVHDFTF